MSSRTGQVANGKGKEGGQAMNEAGYQTLIVKFSEPITVLDGKYPFYYIFFRGIRKYMG